MRALAPLLLATLGEIGSGRALSTTRPGSGGVLLAVHHAGFLVFLVLVSIHILAYTRRVPGLLTGDWRPAHKPPALGRGLRLAVNLAAVLAGALAALLMLPAFAAWIHW